LKDLILKIKRYYIFKKVLRKFYTAVQNNPIVYTDFWKEMRDILHKYTVNDKEFYVYLLNNVIVVRENDEVIVKYDLGGIINENI